MKKNLLLFGIVLSFLLSTNWIQAQNTKKHLNQVGLMNKYVGYWKANANKDTVLYWHIEKFGKSFIINIYQNINGNKIPLYNNNFSFVREKDMFIGFMLYHNGDHETWNGSFTSEKAFSGFKVLDFNPETIYVKFMFNYISPEEWSYTQYGKNNEKLLELRFVKAI